MEIFLSVLLFIASALLIGGFVFAMVNLGDIIQWVRNRTGKIHPVAQEIVELMKRDPDGWKFAGFTDMQHAGSGVGIRAGDGQVELFERSPTGAYTTTIRTFYRRSAMAIAKQMDVLQEAKKDRASAELISKIRAAGRKK